MVVVVVVRRRRSGRGRVRGAGGAGAGGAGAGVGAASSPTMMGSLVATVYRVVGVCTITLGAGAGGASIVFVVTLTTKGPFLDFAPSSSVGMGASLPVMSSKMEPSSTVSSFAFSSSAAPSVRRRFGRGLFLLGRTRGPLLGRSVGPGLLARPQHGLGLFCRPQRRPGSPFAHAASASAALCSAAAGLPPASTARRLARRPARPLPPFALPPPRSPPRWPSPSLRPARRPCSRRPLGSPVAPPLHQPQPPAAALASLASALASAAASACSAVRSAASSEAASFDASVSAADPASLSPCLWSSSATSGRCAGSSLRWCARK